MNIISVNQHDIYGGAARIANDLHRGMNDRGHTAYLAVEHKFGNDPHTLLIPDLPPLSGQWGDFLWKLRVPWKKRLGKSGTGVALRLLRTLADPLGEYHRQCGHEMFNFPGSRLILDLPPEYPQILHLHNLHRDYFDLRIMPEISDKVSTFITLHDEWLLTGHCACTLGCERWCIGCGQCPDLTIYPEILRDSTHYNWEQKLDIYRRSKLYVASPSEWLLAQAKDSILKYAMLEGRVIPNGVDQKVFNPFPRGEARRSLGIDPDASVIMFQSSSNPMGNKFKDFKTVQLAVETILSTRQKKVTVLAIGSKELRKYFDFPNVKVIGFTKDPAEMARYYQASDVFLHAAFTDNYPTAILESLSCGTPVVATSVGGIPEQIKPGENGFLTKKNDFEEMAHFANLILNDENLHATLSNRATAMSRPDHDIETMLDKYESWYEEVLAKKQRGNFEK